MFLRYCLDIQNMCEVNRGWLLDWVHSVEVAGSVRLVSLIIRATLVQNY